MTRLKSMLTERLKKRESPEEESWRSLERMKEMSAARI